MVINGINIDIDTTDLEFNKKFENAVDALREKEKEINEELKKIQNDSKVRSKSIKLQCDAMFAFFDMVLGEEKRKEIFNGKASLKICTNALEEFIANIVAEDKEYSRVMQQSIKKYSPNRAKR